MNTWKHPPNNPLLAKTIECYWYLEKSHEDAGYDFPKLNPDSSTHLVLANADQSYSYRQMDQHDEGTGSHWIFPHSKTFVMDHTQPFKVLGIKFHAGALYSLQLTDLEPLLDRVIPTPQTKQTKAVTRILPELLENAALHPLETCEKLDAFLVPLFSACHEDKHSELVRRALPLLTSTSVANMGDSLHCSQRTLERSFLRVTKFTLKQYQSINRLEAMLEYLYQHTDKAVNWVDVAARFDFSDQPHLIRYLKSTIGTTPGAYAKQRDLAIDVYGNFE